MTKEELMQVVAQNLRRYRDEQGLTQEAVAERAGISLAFLANIERGTKIMSVPVLRSLADSLGVSTDNLLYDGAEDRLADVIALLRDKPDSFILWTEKFLRLALETWESGSKDKQ